MQHNYGWWQWFGIVHLSAFLFPKIWVWTDFFRSAGLSVWNAPSYLASLSGNWIASTAKRTVDARNASDTDCVTPDMMGYVTEDGSIRKVKVPAGQFYDVNDLVEGNDFEALSKLEEYTD